MSWPEVYPEARIFLLFDKIPKCDCCWNLVPCFSFIILVHYSILVYLNKTSTHKREHLIFVCLLI